VDSEQWSATPASKNRSPGTPGSGQEVPATLDLVHGMIVRCGMEIICKIIHRVDEKRILFHRAE
jgi:hypothetical protein